MMLFNFLCMNSFSCREKTIKILKKVPVSNTLLFVTIDCNELIKSSSFNIIVHCSFKMICFRLTNTCDDILSMVEKVNRACDLRVSLTVGCL